MRILLAPMEGVVDHSVRKLLTGIGGIDLCTTEFVRVTHTKLPEKIFRQLMPELSSNCQTHHKIPVRLQLLGGNPQTVALNAQRAVEFGADAIDLNFGCPAKSVNNSDGGACLLREPDRVHSIVKSVRDALPATIAVSAKIRLGFEDRSRYLDNAQAIFDAGANELCVHARSKVDGYKPPAYWDYIRRINESISIPVIANGEVWTLEDYLRCREVSGCKDVMIGRGLMARPDLARSIQAHNNGEDYTPLTWLEICELMYEFHQITESMFATKYLGNRLKQWLAYLRLAYPEAQNFFERVKRLRQPEEFHQAFTQALDFYRKAA